VVAASLAARAEELMASNHRGSSFSLIIGVVGLLCLAALLYLSYEFGRYQAGFKILDVRRATAEQERVIGDQANQIETLERQVAILETAREVDRETYAQVEANLEQLEQQIQAQEQQLAFYQGIVSPEDGAAGLRIQSLAVEPGDGERMFTIRLMLVQAIVHSQKVTGSVNLGVVGRHEDERVTLDLPALGVRNPVAAARYEFRYFQALDFDVTLPVGVVPESVDVEVKPEQPAGPAIAESYSWPR
jgi:cell division protein FtsL